MEVGEVIGLLWYPPWFESFEQFALSATLCVVFGISLCLVRIQETLGDIEKDLRDLSERERKEVGQESEKHER